MQLPVLSTSTTASKLKVSDVVFSVEQSPKLLAQAVRVYLARFRQGTAKTQTRSEVDRSKKKWFKQKGTGNARHGARTPNIFVGGGVSHGPTGLQNWTLNMSSRMRKQALATAFGMMAQTNNAYILDLDTTAELKAARQTLGGLQANEERVLVIIAETKTSVVQKIRNMHNVQVMTAAQVTAVDVTHAHKLVITPGALAKLEARLTASKTVSPKSEKVTQSKAEVVTEKTKATKVATKPATKRVTKAKTK